MKSAINADNLFCRFGHGKSAITAVNNVSFNIKDQEIVTVVGESGSGKTTIARILLRLQKTDSGSLSFYGKPIKDLKKHWQMTQAIFQDPFSSFNSFFTIRRSLLDSFNLFNEKISLSLKIEKITDALKSVGLESSSVLEKFPFELSGGEMQRVLIARIFLIRPKILIADEPTSMIDASSRRVVLDLLLELKVELEMTIIFITHDIGLAHYVSDRIFVMNKGQIVEKGTPNDVIYSPIHPYTRKLLNDIPVLDKHWVDV